MWIFTTYGFFSAVCARQGHGSHGQPVNPDRIMVRARVRAHLEALRTRFPDLLGDYDIQTTPGADYAFRLFVDKRHWSSVVSQLATELDYDNFKSAVAARNPDTGYERALHEVWSVMHRLQR